MGVPGLSRENLEEVTVEVIRPGERARPDVRLIAINGRKYVVKDYGANGTLFKWLLGVYLAWRERAALQRAGGTEGVPRLGGTLGPCALVIEYIESVEVTSAARELLTPAFFERLVALVHELHGRGVVHGDLKKLENVLVTPEGRPALVDFTAAFVTGSNPLTAAVFPWICDDDIRGIYKLKQRCAPELLTEQEAEFLQERSGVEKLFRRVRRYVRYAVKLYSTPEHERASIRLK